ncbi:Cobalt-zinc-cadmium resistance protein CzcD [hydrothermal vent metagenome]|uniref:Cobalt-zinc-cadmium resistance protein CzcD n=1 Tax=hydrothermal vent metagenome TaxID=652676 RepID=A0A3B1CRP7_9ZZZZ
MDSQSTRKRLTIAISLTFFVLLAEVVGGILSNSLALLSDAAHMFGDVFALCLSSFALKISSRPTTSTKTFGLHRMEIFAAFINGITLVIMAAWIFYEAIERFQNPSAVDSLTVIIIAVIGLCTNLGVLYFLKDHGPHSHDLNMKSAFFHVLADMLASVGVIIGAIVMMTTGWYATDAVLSAGIALLLFWGARTILSDAVHILLEGVPKGISVVEVEKELTAIPAIREIHELHIWSICSSIYALSAHALVNDQKVNQVEPVLDEIQELLKTKFNITHSTIQFESRLCQEGEILCDIHH